MKNLTVYKLVSRKTNKFYIGSTLCSLEVRLSHHKDLSRYRKSRLYSAMFNSNLNDWYIIPLFVKKFPNNKIITKSLINRIEQKYIDKLYPRLNSNRANHEETSQPKLCLHCDKVKSISLFKHSSRGERHYYSRNCNQCIVDIKKNKQLLSELPTV